MIESLQLDSKAVTAKTTIIQVYAPPEDSAEADKDKFYDDLYDH